MTGIKYPHSPGEPTPDWGDVRQEQPLVHSVPVDIQGIVSAWSLPAKRSAQLSYIIATTDEPIEVVPGDPRIKNVTFFSASSNASFMVGSREQVNNPNGAGGFPIVAFTPYPPFEGFEEPVYAVALTNGTLGVWISYWAD